MKDHQRVEDASLHRPRLPRLEALIFNRPILCMPGPVMTLESGLAGRLDVAPMRPGAASGRAPRSAGERDPLYALADGVATIAVHGELVNRGSHLAAASGLTSYDALAQALRAAKADGAVRGLVLDLDSPGGEAAGAMETAAVVREIAQSKRVVAFVNSLAGSAAYAIAAGASEIVVTPSATVGSIGVAYLHLDRSGEYASRGVKPTLIFAGARKIDGHSHGALGPAARAAIQGQIDDVYDLFVASVGRHRPALGAEGARATDAALYLGAKGVEAGLADRVGAFEDVLRSFGHSAAAPASAKRAGPAGRSSIPAALAAETTPILPRDPEAVRALGAAHGIFEESRLRTLAGELARVDAEFADERRRARAAGFAEAAAAAVKAERLRIEAILTAQAAQNRRAFAARLALETDMPAAHAIATLLRAPYEPRINLAPTPKTYSSLAQAYAAIRRGEGCLHLRLGAETSEPVSERNDAGAEG